MARHIIEIDITILIDSFEVEAFLSPTSLLSRSGPRVVPITIRVFSNAKRRRRYLMAMRTTQEMIFYAIAVTQSTMAGCMFGDFVQSGLRSVTSRVPRREMSTGVPRPHPLIVCVGKIFFRIRVGFGNFRTTRVLLRICLMVTLVFGTLGALPLRIQRAAQ